MNKKSLIAIMTVMLGTVACGGGGSGGGTAPIAPVVPVTPAPTVSLNLDQSKVTIGQSAKLTWSSTNATSCTASGSWSGAQTTSGIATQTPAVGGQMTYTLTCIGAGGTGAQSVALAVPLPVLKSSYENKIAAATALGPQTLPKEVNSSNSVAFADFFQDGSYSMVTHSLIYDRDNPSTANMLGNVHFYKNVNGNWIDNTSQLLTDTTGCIHPRKAIVADFNGDGKPDVYFACHGFDAAPYVGEHPHLLLSQSDGTYKNVTLPTICYCHGASAADASGKGFADVLVTDNQTNEKVPYVLINNKDGTFAKDLTRLPFTANTYLAPNTNYGAVVMYDAELIDFVGTGKYDAFLAGTEAPDDPSGIPPTIFKNDGTSHYGTPIALPTDSQYETTLDVVYMNGNIYLNRVQTNGGAYGFSSIQKINYKTLVASRIYNNTANFSNGSTWLNWIIPFQGNIVSQSAAYNVSVPQ